MILDALGSVRDAGRGDQRRNRPNGQLMGRADRFGLNSRLILIILTSQSEYKQTGRRVLRSLYSTRRLSINAEPTMPAPSWLPRRPMPSSWSAPPMQLSRRPSPTTARSRPRASMAANIGTSRPAPAPNGRSAMSGRRRQSCWSASPTTRKFARTSASAARLYPPLSGRSVFPARSRDRRCDHGTR